MADADSMRDALKTRFFSADKGDVVILAPACTSFDMFDNFEQRGRVFKEEVRNLKSRKGEI